MFFKLIISLVIIGSTGLIGYILAYRHIQRLQQLKNLYVSFQMLETEIMYSSNNLPRALERVGRKSNKFIRDFFFDTYRFLEDKSGLTLDEAWQKSVEINIANTCLDGEDKEVLLDFGINLGSSDRENQLKNFQLIYLHLIKRQENAEGLRLKNEKMFKNLGVLIGLAIVIVFI